MAEEDEQVNSDTETSENSGSDDPKTPENEANEYEKQRQSRIAQNKSRMEAFGLHKIANSLMESSQKSGKRKSQPKSKRVVKNSKEDDEYEPSDDDEEEQEDDNSDSNLDSSSEEFEGKKKKTNIKNSGSKKVNKRKVRSDKQKSSQKQLDKTELTDEDEAVMQAIALSLKDFEGTSDSHNAGSSQGSKGQATSTNEKRKKKTFKSRVQMTEDDLVINFCQIDEFGKGSILLKDVQRMAATHDFTWTDKELADMIHCFDSDRDGKLSLDDFRNIVQRCNMLQLPENS